MLVLFREEGSMIPIYIYIDIIPIFPYRVFSGSWELSSLSPPEFFCQRPDLNARGSTMLFMEDSVHTPACQFPGTA